MFCHVALCLQFAYVQSMQSHASPIQHERLPWHSCWYYQQCLKLLWDIYLKALEMIGKEVVFLSLIASYGLSIKKQKITNPTLQYTMATIMEKLNKIYSI
jgi:hypothetical protein